MKSTLSTTYPNNDAASSDQGESHSDGIVPTATATATTNTNTPFHPRTRLLSALFTCSQATLARSKSFTEGDMSFPALAFSMPLLNRACAVISPLRQPAADSLFSTTPELDWTLPARRILTSSETSLLVSRLFLLDRTADTVCASVVTPTGCPLTVSSVQETQPTPQLVPQLISTVMNYPRDAPRDSGTCQNVDPSAPVNQNLKSLDGSCLPPSLKNSVIPIHPKPSNLPVSLCSVQDLVRTGRGSLVPDLTPLETLLRIIGEDHRWTDIEVEGDISKLTDYRLRSVKDVRALKDRAWEEMKGVLPITKDLLRTAVGWMPKRQ